MSFYPISSESPVIAAMLMSHGSAFLKGLAPLFHFIWPRQKFAFYFSSMEEKRIVKDPKEWMETLILKGAQRLWLVDYHFEESTPRGIRINNSCGIEVEYPTHLELWMRGRFNRESQSLMELSAREPLDFSRPFKMERHLFGAFPLEKSWREKEYNLETISTQLGEALQILIDFCRRHARDWRHGFEAGLRYLSTPIPKDYKFNNLIPSDLYLQNAKKLLLASKATLMPVGSEVPFGPADYPIFQDIEQRQYDALREESKQIARIGELVAINSINF